MDDLVHGTFERRFRGVRDLVAKNILSGEEVGASIVVNIEGENVIDIWGGYVREEFVIEVDEGDQLKLWI